LWNFASILFELREAVQVKVSHSALDYTWADRGLITPAGNLNANYLQSYKLSAGLSFSQFGERSL
jgi:hypothetical protein